MTAFSQDPDDRGTYKSVTSQLPKQASTYCDGKDAVSCWKGFVAQEGQFTPVGGESCQYNPPRSDCANAVQELKTLHWSFLNNGYSPEVLSSWTAGGCMETIRRNLGYRLVLRIPALFIAGAISVFVSQGAVMKYLGPRATALALLLAGPALSLPSMLVLRSLMGLKKTVVYVTLVVVMSTIGGVLFGALA